MRPIPMAVTTDAGRASISTICKLVNVFPEKSNASSENPVALLTTPGLSLQFKIANEGGIIGGVETPIGSYFCTRKGLYQIKGKKYVKKHDVNLVGRVSIACNGLSIVIVDGYKAYAYILESGKMTELDIPRSSTVIFSDGYYAVSYIDSNQWAVSRLYSIEFDPTAFAAAEGSYDNIQGLTVYKRQIYVIGEKSIEPWYNSGEEFPYNPNQSAYIDIGCYTPWAFTSNINGVFFLGDDKIVYAATGYVPQRISTHAIEYIIGSMNCNKAYMVSYSQEGHDFIGLILPDEDTMLFYDITTGSWHFRESPLGVYESMFTLGPDVYVGFGDGSVYLFDPSIGSEGDKPVNRYCITPSISNNGNRFRNNAVEMLVQYENDGAPKKLLSNMTAAEKMLYVNENSVYMSFTDDDGRLWSDEVAAAPSDDQGKYRWNKLGMSYRRAFKFRTYGKSAGVWAGVYIG